MSADTPISGTLEDYLEAILALERRNGKARVRDIAAELSVHKSTVTAALKALVGRGLVRHAPYEDVALTAAGRAIAEGVRHDHGVIRDFLREILKVDDRAAESNACRMEHVIDSDVLERLVAFVRAVKRCPACRGGCLRACRRRARARG